MNLIDIKKFNKIGNILFDRTIIILFKILCVSYQETINVF